jgi:peroxiredoxin Q/BCP
MAMLEVGDTAPLFRAPLHDGSEFDLATLIGTRAVVLFFYPKDNTPVCTKEACGFRDAYEQFTAAGAEVIGVSSDSVESHRAFAARHRLPFPIVSDRDRAVRRLYGVPNTLGVLPGRVTFVIDRQGVIQLVFNGLLASDEHVRRALAVVERIAAGG